MFKSMYSYVLENTKHTFRACISENLLHTEVQKIILKRITDLTLKKKEENIKTQF